MAPENVTPNARSSEENKRNRKRKTKRVSGIILIVIVAFNVLAWIPDIQKGKSEGAGYYLYILAILAVGIFLLRSSIKKD
jgi:hypothetical protein